MSQYEPAPHSPPGPIGHDVVPLRPTAPQAIVPASEPGVGARGFESPHASETDETSPRIEQSEAFFFFLFIRGEDSVRVARTMHRVALVLDGGSHRRMSDDVLEKVPLAYRVPNAGFSVGRAEDEARLAAMLESAAAVLVHGPSGSGKTTLLAALLRRPAAASRNVLYVPLERRSSHSDSQAPLVEVLRALSRALDLGRDDLALANTADDRIALALDLADSIGAVVVLDDLADAELLRKAHRYARRAKWIATSTSALDFPLAQTLHLSPLSPAALEALAAHVHPHVDARSRSRAVRSAAGSPLRLLRLLDGESEVSALEPAERDLLELVSSLRHPVPLACLTAVFPEAPSLLDRGFLSRHPEGVQAQSESGPSWTTRPAEVSAARALALARALRDSPPSLGSVEALRILLVHARVDEAMELLEERGDALLASGYAVELWPVLSSQREPRLREWQIACAAEAGELEPFATLAFEDAGPSIRGRMSWLKLRFSLEDHGSVAAHFADVEATALRSARSDLAWEACMMGASAYLAFGDHPRASDCLARAKPVDETQALLRDAVGATLAARHGDADHARAVAAELRSKLKLLRGRSRATVVYNLALIYSGLGEPLAAAELLAGGFPVDALATSALLGRRALEVDAYFAVLAGNLAKGREALAMLEKFATPGTPLEGRRILIEATADLLEGDLREASAGAKKGLVLSDAYGGEEDRAYAEALLAQCAYRLGEHPPENGRRRGEEHTRARELARAWRAIANVCAGRATLVDDGDPADAEVAAGLGLARAADHAFRGELERAAREERAALSLIRSSSSIALRLSTEMFALELRVLAGTPLELERMRDFRRLLPRSDAMAELAIYEAFLERGDTSLAPLVDARRGVGLAARIAAGVLDDDDEGPRLSRAIAARIKTALGFRVSLRRDPPRAREVGEPFALDVVRRRIVSLTTNAEIDLRAHTVFMRLLAALAHRGEASKEELVRRVWGVADYHPLHHDNRLRLAVRKLRRLTAPLSDHGLFSTLDDGYALAVPLHWLAPCAPEEFLAPPPAAGAALEP
jgi:hypothetical protein